MRSPASSTTTARGREGEQHALRYLESAGYTILERNYRIRQGEIDLIAEHEGVLCFVEVRTRRDTRSGHPLETVSYAKQQRVIRAASHYLATHGGTAVPARFDVLAIVYEPKVEVTLVRNAFEVDARY